MSRTRGALEYVWYLSERYAPLLLQAFAGVMVVRYLGPATYGDYSFAYLIAQVLIPLAGWGTEDSTYVDFAQRREPPEEIMARAMKVRLLCSIASSLIVAIVLLVRMDHPFSDGYLLFALIPLMDSFAIGLSYLRARGPIRLATLVQSLTAFVFALARLAAIAISLPVFAFVALASFERVAAALWLVVALRKIGIRIPVIFSFEGFFVEIRRNFNLAAGKLSNTLYMYLDNFIVYGFAGAKLYGLYAAACRLVELGYPATLALTNLFYSRAAGKLQEGKLTAAASVDAEVGRTIIPISLAITLGFVLFMPALAHILLGAKFTGTDMLIRVLSLNVLSVGIGNANQYALIAAGRSDVVLVRSIVGVVVCAILCPVFLFLFGLIGAAIASVCTFYTVSSLVLLLWSSESRRILRDQFLLLTFPKAAY